MPWPILPHLLFEDRASFDKVSSAEIASSNRGPLNRRGKTTSVVQQFAGLLRLQLLRSKSRTVNGSPKTIASIGKVISHLSRTYARIDSAENNLQSNREDIGQATDAASRRRP